MLRGMAMKNKKIKITIILLSVLLCISIAALAAVLIRKGKESVPTVSVPGQPDNLKQRKRLIGGDENR